MEKYKHDLIARIIHAPGAEYSASGRLWQGCPTILRTPGGKLFAGWYSGGSREPSLHNYNVLVESCDDGISWSDPLLVIDSLPEHFIQALDIQLWLDPEQRMWLFWVQRDYRTAAYSDPAHLNTWAIICDDPDSEKLIWSDPIFVANGFLRNQPTALSDGRYLFCAYSWDTDRYKYQESCDRGKSFRNCYGARKIITPFDEAMILERKDHSLLMFARAAGAIVKSVSTDGGKSWSESEYTDIPNPGTRCYLRRLRSGRVLLINNQNAKGRFNMTVMLSEDDGETFPYSLILDPTATSYPDASEDQNGNLFIIWDRSRMERKEIVCARITEEDIMAGELKDLNSYCGNIISKAFTPAPGLAAEKIEAIIAEDSAVNEKLREKGQKWGETVRSSGKSVPVKSED